jgi:hypothetical protein
VQASPPTVLIKNVVGPRGRDRRTGIGENSADPIDPFLGTCLSRVNRIMGGPSFGLFFHLPPKCLEEALDRRLIDVERQCDP